MPTEPSTSNGRKSKRRSGARVATTPSDALDTDQLLAVLTAIRKGDFSVKMPMSRVGVAGKISDTLNDIIDLNRETSREFELVSQAVGKEGKITQRAHLHGAAGAWAASITSVNTLIGDLVQPTSEVARVIGAVAKGDLSQTMSLEIEGRPLMGEFLRIGKTVNAMVDQLSSFASEVTRVAREVGTEGKLGGQARVKGVGGTWKDLTDNVNSMAGNLTAQVRNIAQVTTAVANGDLSKKITVDVKGEILELKNTINTMVDQLNSFASEVTRVAREVGTEGKLGGQAQVKGVGGTWKDLTDSVNSMAGNLTGQVRNIADVTTAVANGDLSKKITVDVKGEILELKNTINTMVDQLNSFASEVTRVAREVGTEGKLGGQAQVRGVGGTWKDLTDNVNSMAGNLTAQVRNIAEVTTAVARGELNKKITVDVQGEILELKNTINTMVDQLSSFASEVTRVAREVGTEGKLGGQAQVKGVGGTWKDLTDNVNSMAGNLTAQVRNIADVTTAVARGELNKKITVDVKGEILELKNTINTMVDQLNSFASEVSRVAREVGTEGKLGGQARVKGVGGTWKDLTDNVNSMAGNLTGQVRNIAQVTTAVANGDLSKKITVDVKGEILELKDTINTMVDQLNSFASEVSRVAREVGTEGKLGGQAYVKGVAGTWKDLTDNVNYMAGNLTAQVRNIADVTTAVARGELNKKITVDVQGEILELKNTVNTMVDQLNSFASEVTRVAREVGTEGTLGGQAQVTGVAGVWKDLTDNVNSMAANLTAQVRGIAKVVTAVANGDLKQQLRVEVKGEIATLADTINWMTETLATFADQVTNVAREVGIDGKLGGQARVPGAAGIWRDLTGNVNQLAANLTTQVRAIAEVATAVTKGDLTRSIAVEAQGEVAELKDNINEMIRNLRDTTRKNMEQDWLKTNLAKFSRMLQGQRDLAAVSQLILSDLAPLVTAHHGVVYVVDPAGPEPTLKLLASYAYKDRKHVSSGFRMGEGLVGQCAVERRMLLVNQVPSDYIQISSGLGEAPPRNIVVLPVLFEGEVKAVLELATFDQFDEIRLTFLEQLAESIGIVLNTIEANMRTEELLKQSQALTEGLQSQQEALTETNKRLEQQTRSLQKSEDLLRSQQDELQKTNLELEEKAHLLAGQKAEVEQKNKEVEQAKVALEEKAEQLALISKYKSEFLANMSHELRTPLNSLLILSQLLSENADGNLTPKQVGFSQTIHSSGSDLLDLINDILDLSKIESGTMAVDITTVPFAEVRKFVDSTFRQVADLKGLQFEVDLDPALPPAMQTDTKRLQQVLKNLLSNAFKFTERGGVSLKASVATSGWNPEQEILNGANTVIAFSVTDTGIGIPKEKHSVIFEAFQQGDTGTSRKFGGTGLGLSISRQITRLLGGEIRIESTPGAGSTFTLYLPLLYPAQPGEAPASDEDGAGSVATLSESRPMPTASSRVVLAPVVDRAVSDDRGQIEEGDRVLLIAEDDPHFAQILLDLARERGFKGLVAQTADRALALAREYQPTAVTLDLRFPDADGWTILDRLKHDASTRHIPVHIISVEENWQRGLRLGAIDFLTKPATKESLSDALTTLHEFVDRPVKRLLVVEDDEVQQQSIAELIGNGDVQTTAVTTGADALAALQRETFDCMVLDLGLPDMTGFQLITRVKGETGLRKLPIIVYTGKQLTKREEAELRRIAESVVIKDAQSPERLLDETALFLHRVTERLPESKRRMLEQLHRADPTLVGRKALVVDDDVRNIFALTTFLERSEMKVIHAESGHDGVARLQDTPDVDVVLMDVMMPEMDGYETMRAIRQMPKFRNLPIIAVTAKAMKGDREKCIEAGASDYIAKPVDMEQLLSLLRVWLYR
ncbi:MAG TPA: HAMP domain-containing protein [Gemmatimonadales bacterium]|nr:HAMP domain-containing protein [Gemmatimonadales bacterium]